MQKQYSTPLKRCTICGNEFPATTEYFTKDKANKSGLRPQCKACYRQKQKDWRSADPERYAEYQHQQYLSNPEKVKARVSAWNKTPKGKAAKATYRKENKEKHSAYDRDRYSKNRDSVIDRVRSWQRDNPEKRTAIRNRYSARKGGLVDAFTEADWKFALDHFNGRCAVCGRPPGFFHKLQADHWIPISNPDCPGTVPHNIVPLCGGLGGCNQKKNASDPQKWLNNSYGAKEARAISNRIHAYFRLVSKN